MGSSAAIQNRMTVHKYMLVFYSVIFRFASAGVKLAFKIYKGYFIGIDTKQTFNKMLWSKVCIRHHLTLHCFAFLLLAIYPDPILSFPNFSPLASE